jgi:hypothetical protein
VFVTFDSAVCIYVTAIVLGAIFVFRAPEGERRYEVIAVRYE